jgi:hypothetical protein
MRQTGRIPEAIAQCQAALQFRPDDAKAHNNLANALLDADRGLSTIARTGWCGRNAHSGRWRAIQVRNPRSRGGALFRRKGAVGGRRLG